MAEPVPGSAVTAARSDARERMGLHAFHASELPYVFGNVARTPEFWPKLPDSKTERNLSEAMMGYWVSFARDRKPDATGWPAWRPYAPGKAYMRFADAPRGGADLLPGMYELHEEVMCRRLAADIRRTRKGQHPQAHLKGFRGVLQVDAFAGFNPLYGAALRARR
jgi:hypothetical protein